MQSPLKVYAGLTRTGLSMLIHSPILPISPDIFSKITQSDNKYQPLYLEREMGFELKIVIVEFDLLQAKNYF